ncbi:hypothetical protein [uncultured Modestobacter sp.]|uniref:hypothetical protein n=1 Tax=uncultured Modestobacter sp. TaxID=380048 RepID=UPI0026020050|nr:hypothetical protein [uncultured Modestobacter sp.]
MSISAVGSSSAVIAAAFRQSQAADARTGAQRTPGGAAGAAPASGTTDGSTPAIAALKQQLAEAQEALQRLVDAKADEQAIRAAQQRVHACASALAAALTQQAAAAAKAERAASAGEQYL